MKKLFLIMFLAILLVGSVSAADWDNKRDYIDNDMTVILTNWLGLGEELGRATLTSHNSVEEVRGVIRGDDRVVMYYDFKDWELYEDGLGEVTFIDMKTNKTIEKEYKFVKAIYENVSINDYKETCLQKFSLNFTPYEDCSKSIIGQHTEEKFVRWEELKNNDIPAGNNRIGLMVDVLPGEHLDAFWKIAGKKVRKHAEWTDSLNTNLWSYYKLDESSGVIIDSSDNVNGTLQGSTTQGVTGKIGNAINFTANDAFVNATITAVSELSVNMWLREIGTADSYAGGWEAGLGGVWKAMLRGTDTTEAIFQFSGGGVALSSGVDITDGNWHMLTGVYNTSHVILYVDGVVEASAAQTGTYPFDAQEFGRAEFALTTKSWSGEHDEIGVWVNRSLSESEVTELWNNSYGITWEEITETFPIVSLNSPIDNLNTTSQTINFNGIVSDNYEIVNASLILDDVYNQTNTSGLNNSNYIFSLTLGDGTYSWNYETCDNASQCTNATARTLTIGDFFENSQASNNFTYETATEVFSINITARSTPSSAIFVYNGTSQGSATITSLGNDNYNISKSMDIPLGTGNNTWLFNTTINSVVTSSTSNQQNVSVTNFTICQTAPQDIPYLNISFKNETQDAIINASIPTSTFVYWLGSGTITKTYNFINNSDNYNYGFCAFPSKRTFNIDPYLQYKQGANYPQRVYDAGTAQYTNATTNLTLYLLQVSNGIYVTLQVVNTATQVISGVEVTAEREITGENITVGQGTTGADGAVTFWLNPDFVHYFNFSKTGFTTSELSFSPTQSSYTITLTGGANVTVSYFRGIDYSVLPLNLSLTNDTIYSFGFNLTSSFWDLTEYGFDLRLVNGTILTGDSTSTSGTQLSLDYNTTNQTKIYMDYYWLIDSTYTNSTKVWIVYDTDKTQWSIFTFFIDLDTYLDSGFFGIDNFGRYLIIFIIIFFSVGIMSFKFGFTSPLTISLTTFLVVFFFDVVVGIIPPLTIASGNEIPYLLTFLTGLILSVTIFKEVSR